MSQSFNGQSRPWAFKDAAGREWAIPFSVTDFNRVQRETNFNLFTIFDGQMEAWGKLTEDIAQFVGVLYALIQEQAEKANVSPEDFGRGLWGDALDRATDAFGEAMLNFCRDSKRREALRVVMKKAKELDSLITNRALSEAEKLDTAQSFQQIERLVQETKASREAALEERLRTLIASPSRSSSTSLPASAPLTPAPSPSDS